MPHQTQSGQQVTVTAGTHLARITCSGCHEQWTVKKQEAKLLAARHAENCHRSPHGH